MEKKTLEIGMVFAALLAAGCGPAAAGTANGATGADAGAKNDSGGGGGGGAGGPVDDGGAPPDLSFAISPGTNAHAVSPLIYGINGAAAATAYKARLVRLGGNRLPAYNWEVNDTNGGMPEGFANLGLSAAATPGGAAKEVLDAAKAGGGVAMLTVPIGDYVAADRNPGDVHASGTGFLTTRFKKNKAVKGTPPLASPNLTDDSVYEDEFVSWAKGAAAGTPTVFSLDNQPELWADDHAEIHPLKATYAEVVARGVAFAKAIKTAWPEAPVAGYASYGWLGYESLQDAPDAQANGEFIAYYLAQMKVAETQSGKRLLDYLELHWWPEAQGGGVRIIEADSSPDVAAARVQAPRSLWDAAYHETSWIDDTLAGEAINLLPRVKDRISASYPGTKLAFSAWYYGGGGDISGALATADVLGIFGRDGVDLAAVDLSGGDDSYTLGGFQAFLSFDGAGAHFGDTSVEATTNDPAGSSVYASTESADPTHVVILAINKRPDARDASITIAGATKYASCEVFTLTAGSPAFAAGKPLTAAGASTFTYPMPAMSLSVIVPKP